MANRDFVSKYPIATRRALRAYLKATDICLREPERVARYLADKEYEPRYEIGLDTLCYRSWTELARITTRELARYMGLYPNIEEEFVLPDLTKPEIRRDPIVDSDDSSTNLMYNSELGGSELSDGQRFVLTRSPVLR